MEDVSTNTEMDLSEFKRLTHLSEEDLRDIEKGGEVGASSNTPNKPYWLAVTAALIIARRDVKESIPSRDFQLVTIPGKEGQKLGITIKGKPIYPAGIEDRGELVPDPTFGKDFNVAVIQMGRYVPPGYAKRDRL
ncbi:MAG TPA: hypothetical protein VM077_02995 [Candidatus Limnocylindrales bacterium]|nr:hypothetical protein [Candidatus Limnocylindrales bacterium]